MEEDIEFFLVPEDGLPLEFSLYDLLDVNIFSLLEKEDVVNELNRIIRAIEKYRDDFEQCG